LSAAIEEHSICHPGLPSPQGEGHLGSFSLDFFQSAKSSGDLLSLSEVKAPSPSLSFIC